MVKVSVIIPTYNRAQCVCRAIDSVLRQTYADHEIIVVDDGSTDNTKDVLLKYNGRIKYVHQPNGGISNARNHGIRVSTGEYIAFLDSDDEWVPEKLAVQLKLLESNKKLGIVCSKMIILDEDGRECGMKPEERTGRNFRELIEIGGDLPTSSVMTRRECFDKVGMFDESLPMMEDFEMWVRIASQYDIHIFTKEALAYYHKHAHQITRNMTLVYESTIKLQEKILHNFRHTPGFPEEIVKKRIAFNQYVLSRIYHNDKRYTEAFRLLRGAMRQCPMIGAQFFERDELVTVKAVKMIKPYGYFIVCFLHRYFASGRS